MAALDPKGPSQPTKQQAYETEGNPATLEPAESRAAGSNAQHTANNSPVDRRVPQEQSPSTDQAQPTALGRGVRGAGPGEEVLGKTHEDVGRHRELDGQQMAAPGEGDVYQAVEGKHGKQGATGEQEDLASDLERKKAEQAPAREAIKRRREHDVDVGGILGQRGGPANPVGKGNYPNSGD